MKSALRLIFVVLASAALVGCSRTDVPAGQPKTASPKPQLCVLIIDLVDGKALRPSEAMGCPSSASRHFGGPRVVHVDGTDNEGRAWSETRVIRTPEGGFSFENLDGDKLKLSAHMVIDGTERSAEGELTVQRGNVQTVLVPLDKPRYAFVFCVVPEPEHESDSAAASAPRLLLVEMKWDSGEPEASAKIFDLTDPKEPNMGGGFGSWSSFSGLVVEEGIDNKGRPRSKIYDPSEGDGPSGRWGLSRKDERTIGYSAKLRLKDEFDDGTEGELPIEKGKTAVVLLPRDNPRYGWVFCVLPQAEGGGK